MAVVRTIKGGEKFEAKMLELAKKLNRKETLRVGFLEGATYPDGTPVAFVAATQNYGAPKAGIPPRPFFSNMIIEKSPQWPDVLAAKLIATDYDMNKTLNAVGELIVGQLQESIINTNSPPLSPVSLMLRKMFGNHPEDIRGKDVAEARRRVDAGESTEGVSAKPLIWTSHLINSVAYEIKT